MKSTGTDMIEFNDSIENNIEVITELLRGVPAPARNRAKRAAVLIENTVTQLQKDYPKDPYVALGAAFAIFKLAERIVTAPKQGDSEERGLIQLLS
jgi:hypothetical protein